MSLAVAIVPGEGSKIALLPSPQQSSALADMRSYLSRVKPQSAAESLRLLRNAYPQTSLSLRVAACGL